MKDAEYEIMYNVEDEFWWFKALRLLYRDLLNELKKDKYLKILDAGCGTGRNMKLLEQYGEVVGIDISDQALFFSKKRGNKVVKGSITQLPFKDEQFDIVLASDVIYHQWVDDKGALKEIHRVLKKGGYLIVNTASYQFMMSEHDKAVMSKVRYTKSGLKQLLKSSGFRINKIFYWNSFLFPPLAVLRMLKINTGKSDLKEMNHSLNQFLFGVLKVERKLINYKLSLPFGLSIMAKAQK
ncbi:MAG: methyltransferase domain-containing protein [Candidatus Nanoarchaeia archaeon]